MVESINECYENFMQSCYNYEKYILDSQYMYIHLLEKDGVIFNKQMRDMIIEYSFLKMYLSWEAYQEEIFLAYCIGLPGINGKKVNCYVSPKDYGHAYDLVKGNSKYPDWTIWSNVVKLSNHFFDEGIPFVKLKSLSTELEHLKTLRNSISHMSTNSKSKFETLVRINVGHYPLNTTPADFLIMNKSVDPDPITYTNHYFSSIRYLANELANPEHTST